jgi:site-specific DNA-methyltransferase (adenine-specific)
LTSTPATLGTLAIDPKAVVVSWRARSDFGEINELAASIQEQGQIHPIAVMGLPSGKYELLAGYRRLKACAMLKIDVRAEVRQPRDALHALAIQLHENMRRKGFDLLEESEGFRRYKEIYEAAHPETKHGASGGGRSKAAVAARAGAEPAPRFTEVAAKATAICERRVAEMLEISKLPAAYLRDIKAAKTTAERNRLSQEALRKVRSERKVRRMQEEVAERRQLDLSEARKPPVVIYCGDYRNHPSLKATEQFDLCLTDPPYDRERSLIGHVARASIGKTLDWDKLDLGWVLRVAPTLAPKGQILAFCPFEAIGGYELAFQAAKLIYKGTLVWHKTNPGPVYRASYQWACEAIVWAARGDGCTFMPWEEQAGATAHNLIEGAICQGNERTEHPTQKPLWLIMRLLQRHAVEGQRVLDPFCGSGTTLVAARKLGLEAIGIEREEKFAEIARLRMQHLRP